MRSVATFGFTLPVFGINKGIKPAVEYRTLGNTGLKVSVVSYGAMMTRDPAIIHKALDLGINFIDTARVYMAGYNEVIVGKVLRNRRREVYVATKFRPGKKTTDGMIKTFEKSLKVLQTDYVDIIYLHNLKRTTQINNEQAMEALQRIKKEGKARFIGFSSHQNQVELIKEAIKMDFYDVILTAYHFQSAQDLSDVIMKAAQAGIGIVAMKTQAGGYKEHEMKNVSPHQAALKWVLQNRGVACAIPSMVTYGQLYENIQAMGSKMGWQDRKILQKYGQLINQKFCRLCDECKNHCPKGVDVFNINRSLMYTQGYKNFDQAVNTYRSIKTEKLPYSCQDCSQCIVQCRYGLDIRSNMLNALNTFI
jgi:predicted aldo/keto reductase-like oxidoreductase